MNNIDRMLNKIELINSKENFINFFHELETIFCYSWASLIVFPPSLTRDVSPLELGNIPRKLKAFILNDKQIKHYCFTESYPITYHKLHLNKNNELFNSDESTLIVPIKGIGYESSCLLLAMPKSKIAESLVEQIGCYWLMLSPLIYEKYYKLFNRSLNNKMTNRELECIKWASEGKTSWEISQLLAISQRTVDFHLANCISKTGSINRQQAIVKCILDGQLITS